MRAVIPLVVVLLSFPILAMASSDRSTGEARTGIAHDPNHPFVLANDADFLTALIALYEESLDASLFARTRIHDKKVKAYASSVASSHRDEISRFRKLLAWLGAATRPDYHLESRLADLPNLSGTAADRYYLNGMSLLVAAKIELAEFASGTVKSRAIRQLAERLIENKSGELSMLSRWIKGYGAD